MATLSRDDLATQYLDQLPYTPYKVQEDALLAWFSSEQGVLVCAPTGTGKTLIAEAALFEALHTGTRAYYTTPLIALTEQKFREMQHRAVDWGFKETDVGLVTGNRRENPQAPVLVVVAEILLNRLLHGECDFSTASAVVMDEFHSFNDPERGIVWELTLGMLPPHVRTLLLSATVGNAMDFIHWLRLSHKRVLELVVGEERKVPLTYHWVGDELLSEQLERMAEGDADERMLPALVFCFNRDECWSVAEQIKGKQVLASGQQSLLVDALAKYEWGQGAGTKLRQLLLRGVGVHHAGLLPKYRRIVEELFQERLLSVALCTETLAAGINLPARSVVLPSILKGPPGKKRLIEPSAAHQIFGRAGRPQFDTQGHAYVLAHEDDVRIARWKVQYDQIPENTKDPGLLKAKKALKKKMPHRRDNEQYWNEAQFQKLVAAPPDKLFSRGPLPWRLLSYVLDASPEVDKIRQLVSKRLMDATHLKAAQLDLDRMLVVLHRGGYVRLEPPPPEPDITPEIKLEGEAISGETADAKRRPVLNMMFSEPIKAKTDAPVDKVAAPLYKPAFAYPLEGLKDLTLFRGVHPLYAKFLLKHLGLADRRERLQAFESVLDFPPPVARYVRVPKQHDMPPGPLATERLDTLLLQHGLATIDELVERSQEEEEPYKPRRSFDAEQDEEPKRVLPVADKLRKLFDFESPNVFDLRTRAVWAAGELLMDYGGNFNKFISGKDLAKQEGIVFRHLLRMILLIEEFRSMLPADIDAAAWRYEVDEITDQLTRCCREVDPESTDKLLEKKEEPEEPEQFGAGIFD